MRDVFTASLLYAKLSLAKLLTSRFSLSLSVCVRTTIDCVPSSVTRREISLHRRRLKRIRAHVAGEEQEEAHKPRVRKVAKWAGARWHRRNVQPTADLQRHSFA